MNTAYADLSEAEKDADRKEAREILKLAVPERPEPANELLDAAKRCLKIFQDLDRALIQAQERNALHVHVGDLRKLPRELVPLLTRVIAAAEPSAPCAVTPEEE